MVKILKIFLSSNGDLLDSYGYHPFRLILHWPIYSYIEAFKPLLPSPFNTSYYKNIFIEINFLPKIETLFNYVVIKQIW